MVISFRIPDVRSLGLILTGVLLGATLGGPVLARDSATLTPQAVQTRYAGCSSMNFFPIDSATGYDSVAGRRIRTGPDGQGYFTCDPNLPNRAVVTAVRFTLWDVSNAAEVRNCALLRHGLTTTTASTFEVVGQVSTTGDTAQPGTVRKTTTTITNATVNLSLYAYLLQCEMTYGAVAIYGASVTFTIDPAYG